ncbi:hypothetical protein FCV25MIE_07572, partial [Fagus crenata]
LHQLTNFHFLCFVMVFCFVFIQKCENSSKPIIFIAPSKPTPPPAISSARLFIAPAFQLRLCKLFLRRRRCRRTNGGGDGIGQ